MPLASPPAPRPPVALLVPESPAWYAPYLETEAALLAREGLTVHVHALGRRAPLSHVVRAHARLLATRPAAYGRGLGAAAGFARRAAGPHAGPAARAVTLACWLWYFLWAVVAGDALARRGVRHCHAHFTSNVAVLLPAMFPLDLSLTFHGATDFAPAAARLLPAKIAAATFVRAVSGDGHRRLLRHAPPDCRTRVHRVPLGVDTARFAPPGPPPAVPPNGSPGAVPGAAPVRLLCVARLEPVKDHATLLDAFARLVAGGHDVTLDLAGDGTCRGALEAHADRLGVRDRVRFLGVVPNAALPAVYARADVVVLASRAEGLPVTLAEAMSAGRACVATRVGGVPELIPDARYGVTVPAGDPAALAAALGALAGSPARRARLGRRARGHVAAHYRAETGAAALARLLADPSARDGGGLQVAHGVPRRPEPHRDRRAHGRRRQHLRVGAVL